MPGPRAFAKANCLSSRGGTNSDRVNFGHGRTLGTNPNQLTTIVWIYPIALAAARLYARKETSDVSGFEEEYQLRSTGQIDFYRRTSGVVADANARSANSAGSIVSTGKWWWVACTLDSAFKPRIYLATETSPPVEVSYTTQVSGTTGNADNSAADFVLGNSYPNTAPPNARYAHVANWGRALTLRELIEQWWCPRPTSDIRLMCDIDGRQKVQLDRSPAKHLGLVTGCGAVPGMPRRAKPRRRRSLRARVPITVSGIVASGAFSAAAGTTTEAAASASAVVASAALSAVAGSTTEAAATASAVVAACALSAVAGTVTEAAASASGAVAACALSAVGGTTTEAAATASAVIASCAFSCVSGTTSLGSSWSLQHSDTGDRADTSEIDGSTMSDGLGAWSARRGTTVGIVSNKFQNGTAARKVYYDSASGAIGDQRASIAPDTFDGAGPAVRVQGDGSCYFFKTSAGSSSLIWFDMQFGGTGDVNVLDSSGPGFAAADEALIEVVGDSISCFKNGALVIGPITDTNYATGRPGFFVDASTSLVFDNWNSYVPAGSTGAVTVSGVVASCAFSAVAGTTTEAAASASAIVASCVFSAVPGTATQDASTVSNVTASFAMTGVPGTTTEAAASSSGVVASCAFSAVPGSTSVGPETVTGAAAAAALSAVVGSATTGSALVSGVIALTAFTGVAGTITLPPASAAAVVVQVALQAIKGAITVGVTTAPPPVEALELYELHALEGYEVRAVEGYEIRALEG